MLVPMDSMAFCKLVELSVHRLCCVGRGVTLRLRLMCKIWPGAHRGAKVPVNGCGHILYAENSAKHELNINRIVHVAQASVGQKSFGSLPENARSPNASLQAEPTARRKKASLSLPFDASAREARVLRCGKIALVTDRCKKNCACALHRHRARATQGICCVAVLVVALTSPYPCQSTHPRARTHTHTRALARTCTHAQLVPLMACVFVFTIPFGSRRFLR